MKSLSIIQMILLIIGILLFLWFLIPVIATGNYKNIGSVTGLGISALLIIYGIWMRPINRFIRLLWSHTAGKILEILILAVCAGILVLAVLCSAAMLSASSKKPEPGSTVIVLGARVYQNRVSLSLAGRLDAAFSYLQENPESVCIVSGGQGENEPCTEASLMYSYLLAKGIEENRLYMEDQSTDTQENIAFSKRLIEQNSLNPQVALATDGYHEYRALQYAKEAGLAAGAVPAPAIWWLFPTNVIREMYGILEQWFLK